LYKYIYKEHDVAAITVEPITEIIIVDYDEIHNCIEVRYVRPVEATWRILKKKLQDKSHVVVRLPVHFPNEQNIVIESRSNEETIIFTLYQVTMLIDYFALNFRESETILAYRNSMLLYIKKKKLMTKLFHVGSNEVVITIV